MDIDSHSNEIKQLKGSVSHFSYNKSVLSTLATDSDVWCILCQWLACWSLLLVTMADSPLPTSAW